MTKPALLMDRDGVINRDAGFVSRRENFHFIDGSIESMKSWSAAGYKLIVITNQSGIGRGYYSASDFAKLNDWMLEELEAKGVEITGVYHCPHAPEKKCECRKPAPGMIQQAQTEHKIDLAQSWLVGDKITDIEAGRKAGVGNLVLVRSGQFRRNSLDAADVKIMEDLGETCKLIPTQV